MLPPYAAKDAFQPVAPWIEPILRSTGCRGAHWDEQKDAASGSRFEDDRRR